MLSELAPLARRRNGGLDWLTGDMRSAIASPAAIPPLA